MMRIQTPLVLCLLLIGGSAYAIDPFIANYEARKLGMTLGKLQLKLHKSANGYIFEADSHTAGVVSWFRTNTVNERSHWHMQNDTVQTMDYQFTQTGKRSRNIKVEFQWPRRQVTKFMNGKKTVETIPSNGHDRLSYQIALMKALNAGEKSFDYQVLEKNGFRHYEFKVVKEEKLKTTFGYLDTVKVEKVRKNQSNQRATVFWCAKKLTYLPVRIQHTEKDGSVFNMYIKSLEGDLKRLLN